MEDNWIREPEEPQPARPIEPPDGPAIPVDDPQAGQLVRDAEDVPDAARPLHPDVGGPIGSS